ncbi:MAG: ABC transporter permease [Oscillospiraceae bacterium]
MLSVVQTVFATLFGVTTFGMLLLTLVLMVYRFYKNLMTDEGYLMFTLPVSRSQLIWSKLLVALVWSVLSTVLAALAWMAEISVVGRENVFSLIAQGLRSLRQHLSGNLTGCAAALVVLCLVSCLVSFLKFYAAISLGHSFSNHKVLLSVVFYIGFGIVTQTIGSIFASVGIQIDISPDFWSSLPVTQVFSSLAWAAAGCPPCWGGVLRADPADAEKAAESAIIPGGTASGSVKTTGPEAVFLWGPTRFGSRRKSPLTNRPDTAIMELFIKLFGEIPIQRGACP